MLKEKTKLTLLIETELIERAKQYAGKHNTSILQLVSHYLASLEPVAKEDEELTPSVRNLLGSLPPGPGIEAYYGYLENKHRD